MNLVIQLWVLSVYGFTLNKRVCHFYILIQIDTWVCFFELMVGIVALFQLVITCFVILQNCWTVLFDQFKIISRFLYLLFQKLFLVHYCIIRSNHVSGKEKHHNQRHHKDIDLCYVLRLQIQLHICLPFLLLLHLTAWFFTHFYRTTNFY